MVKHSHPVALIFMGILASFIHSENQVSGQCCKATICDGCTWGFCGDGTNPTPCCGYNGCNIFCCNCSDGGCRGKRSGGPERWIREVGTEHPDEHAHDTNKDGFYDMEEVHNRLLSGSCGNYTEKMDKWKSEFERMDKDQDGKLSYEEING